MNLASARSRPWFSAAIGLAVTSIVIVGFARTYYFKTFFDTRPLTLRLQVHGFFLTAWLMLFLVQTLLIATHRRALHMRLGIAGAVLAALAVITTYAAAFESAVHGVAQNAPMAISRLYSSMELAALFGLFVAAGIVFRRRPEIHKRLMILAMLAVVGPAAHRAATLIVGSASPHSHVVVIAFLFSACLVYDWRARGIPHPVLLWGGVVLIGLQWSRRIVGGSELWQKIGSWLIS